MKTYDQIASELFAKRDEREKRIARNMKTAGLIIVPCVAVAAAILIAVSAHKKPNGPIYVDNSPVPVTETPAVTFTPDPHTSAGPTMPPEETVPPETEKPDVYYYVSEHPDYAAAAHALLSGGEAEGTFTMDGGGVFFGFEGDRLIAYRRAKWYGEIGDTALELSDPIASYPAELGIRAKESLAEFNGTSYVETDQLYGYIGENYVIFTNEQHMGSQDRAIFRTDDGENWYEFGAMKDNRAQLTGGAILNANEGFLCFYDRAIMMYDSYTPRQLSVYRTIDGGKTWSDIGLWIPEEYEGKIAPPSYVLSPVFEGEHGVLIVVYSVCVNTSTGSFEQRTAHFETFDGGDTWTFFPPKTEV